MNMSTTYVCLRYLPPHTHGTRRDAAPWRRCPSAAKKPVATSPRKPRFGPSDLDASSSLPSSSKKSSESSGRRPTRRRRRIRTRARRVAQSRFSSLSFPLAARRARTTAVLKPPGVGTGKRPAPSTLRAARDVARRARRRHRQRRRCERRARQQRRDARRLRRHVDDRAGGADVSADVSGGGDGDAEAAPGDAAAPRPRARPRGGASDARRRLGHRAPKRSTLPVERAGVIESATTRRPFRANNDPCVRLRENARRFVRRVRRVRRRSARRSAVSKPPSRRRRRRRRRRALDAQRARQLPRRRRLPPPRARGRPVRVRVARGARPRRRSAARKSCLASVRAV